MAHLAEGNGIKSTARLVGVDAQTVRRLSKKAGEHSQRFHAAHVKRLAIRTLQVDERHGYAGCKANVIWEAEVIDPVSKLVISHVQGKRNATLIHRLFSDTASRLINPQRVALFSDGFVSYKSLFPIYFGYPTQPKRNGRHGGIPHVKYRVPRTAAHVQVIKHHKGRRLSRIEICYAHGSKRRITTALSEAGFKKPNTSTIERYNATARLMTATQARRGLTFAKRVDMKGYRSWWALTVYNWCRPHRSLREKLPTPIGKRKYQQRSPAMAASLADCIFSQAKILLSPVYPALGWR